MSNVFSETKEISSYSLSYYYYFQHISFHDITKKGKISKVMIFLEFLHLSSYLGSEKFNFLVTSFPVHKSKIVDFTSDLKSIITS